ncbi:type VI secretion system contractile sheath large subunit [Roseomonas sp. CAU 1739]|uniref:type VI secretion system contractile sheath domain-containing protein n=1 Tax=Roseomonas sp. CAU 1739 TaxID=3140364 RepID=UPI00325AEA44
MTSPSTAPPPRFTMTYPSEAEGFEYDRELPFRVGIFADLAGDSTIGLPPPAERCFLVLTGDGIAGAMARLKPGLRLTLHEPEEGLSTEVVLAFRSLADFEPIGLSRQLAAAGVTPTLDRLEGIRKNERLLRLEAAWRGLDLLTARAGTDAAVEICVLPISRAEFANVLRPSDGVTVEWLRRRIHDDTFLRRGAEPFALLLSDLAWTDAAEDIETLDLMAGIATSTFSPFVSAAQEALLGLAGRACPNATAGTSEAAWRALGASEASRFLVLTTPPTIGGIPTPFLVTTSLRRLLASPQELLPLLSTTITGPDGAGQVQQLLRRAERLTQRWDSMPPTEIREMLLRLLPRVVVHPEQVELHLTAQDLPAVLRGEAASVRTDIDTASTEAGAPSAAPIPIYIITVPARLRRAGIEMALVVDGEQQPSRTDPALIRLVARAQALRDRLVLDDGVSADDFATREGVTQSWVTRLVRIAYLAPDIVAAILEGKQPVELTANRLLQDTRLPIAWT